MAKAKKGPLSKGVREYETLREVLESLTLEEIHDIGKEIKKLVKKPRCTVGLTLKERKGKKLLGELCGAWAMYQGYRSGHRQFTCTDHLETACAHGWTRIRKLTGRERIESTKEETAHA